MSVRWNEFDMNVLGSDVHDAIAIGNEIRRITVTPGMTTSQFINALAAESNHQPSGWCKSMMTAVTAMWIVKLFKGDEDPSFRSEFSRVAVSSWTNFAREMNALPSAQSPSGRVAWHLKTTEKYK